MSGALAERDFVEKLAKVGFDRIEIVNRQPWSIDDCALIPLFDDDLLALMRRLIPVPQHDHVADSIVLKARINPNN